MNCFSRMALGLGVLLAIGGPVLAQAPTADAKPAKQAKGGQHGGMALTAMPVDAINTFATLKDDQKTKITAIQDKLKADVKAGGNRKDLAPKAPDDIKAVLTPDQMTKLTEAAPMVTALNQSKAVPVGVISKLNLTEDQISKIKAETDSLHTKLKSAPKGDKAAQQAALDEFKTRVDGILTPAQKEMVASYHPGAKKKKA